MVGLKTEDISYEQAPASNLVFLLDVSGSMDMDEYENYDVTDEQWERIQPQLPPERTGKKGRPRKDDRTMLNGMLWMNHSGAQWRQLPQCYGPWQSVYARFAKWRDDGLWEKIFTVLSQDADTENLSIDSTCVKVHESSNGGEKNGK